MAAPKFVIQRALPAMAAAAIMSGNVVWCKKMATLCENTARTLRLYCGPSGTANRVPLGVLYTEPTNAITLKRAFDLAGADPQATATALVATGVRLHEAKRAIRWAHAVRVEAGSEADGSAFGLYWIGTGKKKQALKIKVML